MRAVEARAGLIDEWKGFAMQHPDWACAQSDVKQIKEPVTLPPPLPPWPPADCALTRRLTPLLGGHAHLCDWLDARPLHCRVCCCVWWRNLCRS
jgi:hypothetical protein